MMLVVLHGRQIAQRIEWLLRKSKGASVTQLGQLLCPSRVVGARALRKRVSDFLGKVRRGRILQELNILAEFLDVPLDFLLFGRLPRIREESRPS